LLRKSLRRRFIEGPRRMGPCVRRDDTGGLLHTLYKWRAVTG
jgi:hypothetical protein